MAYTSSNLVKTVFGDKYVQVFRVTADAASGTVDTGFNIIEGSLGLTPRSATTTGFRTYLNGTAASAACNGVIGFSGMVSGDIIDIAVFGR